MKRILSIIFALLILTLTSCAKTNNKEVIDPNDKTDYNLRYSDKDDSISLSNNNIRIVFNKNNGSIKEIYNLKSDLYLVKDIESENPIALQIEGHYSENFITPIDNSFKYSLTTNSNTIKSLSFEWSFENGVKANTTASLKGNGDEIIFMIELSNLDSETSTVSYPIVDNITEISEGGEDDYFLTSFATGYLIQNPVKNCNKFGLDFTGDHSIYPLGFGQTMQFMSYFVKDVGGFHLQTRDSSDNIKSFNLRRNGDSVTLDIGHFVNDLTHKTEKFNYETVIKNLYEGNWYEAAEVYKAWAINQPWCTTNGLNKNRTDINKELYENTILCNFVMPSRSTQQYAVDLYDKVRKNIKTENSKILNIPFYGSINQTVDPTQNFTAFFEANANNDFYEIVEDYDDLIAFFEYTDLEFDQSMDSLPSYISDYVMRKYNGSIETITFSLKMQYICAANSPWMTLLANRDKEQFEKLVI